MNENNFKRVQISVLFLISYLGALISHMTPFIIYNEEFLTKYGTTSMMLMNVLTWIILLVPVVLPLITNAKKTTRIISIIFAVFAIAHGVSHMTYPAYFFSGIVMLVVGGAPTVIGTIIAFKWARVKE